MATQQPPAQQTPPPTEAVPTPQRPSTTTVEQNLRTASQRRINLIWEYTQAAIALTTVIANIVYIFTLLFVKDVSTNATTAAVLLSNAFFLVIGFYFGRTNHARIGDTPQLAGSGPLDDRNSSL